MEAQISETFFIVGIVMGLLLIWMAALSSYILKMRKELKAWKIAVKSLTTIAIDCWIGCFAADTDQKTQDTLEEQLRYKITEGM